MYLSPTLSIWLAIAGITFCWIICCCASYIQDIHKPKKESKKPRVNLPSPIKVVSRPREPRLAPITIDQSHWTNHWQTKNPTKGNIKKAAHQKDPEATIDEEEAQESRPVAAAKSARVQSPSHPRIINKSDRRHSEVQRIRFIPHTALAATSGTMEEIQHRIEVYQTTIKQRETQLQQLNKEELVLKSELAELISNDYKCRQEELALESQCLDLQINISQEEERKNRAEAEILQLSCITMAKDEEGGDEETDSAIKRENLMLEMDIATRIRDSWLSRSDAKRIELIKEITGISSNLAKCQRDRRRLVSEAMKSDKDHETATRCGIVSTEKITGTQQQTEATHQMLVDIGNEAEAVKLTLEPLEKNLEVAKAQLKKLDEEERKLKSELDSARQRSAGRPHLWS